MNSPEGIYSGVTTLSLIETPPLSPKFVLICIDIILISLCCGLLL